MSFARETAFAVATGLGVLLVAGLILFTFSQVIDSMPFGDPFVWANVGLVVALIVSVFALATAIQIGARRWGKALTRTVLVAPVAVLFAIVVFLSAQPPPTPVDVVEPYLPERAHDVVLVVDPSDPYVRSLAQQARSTPATVAPTQVSGWGTDVAFGLAVLVPRGPDAPWSLVLAPTPDHDRFVQALAQLEPSSAGRATRSLPVTLRDLTALGSDSVDWREGATRTIAFVTDSLPTQAELRGPSDPQGDIWDAALEALGRSADLRPDHPRRSSLSVMYRAATKAALSQWTRWSRAAAGNLGEPNEFFTAVDDLAFKSLNRFSADDFLLALRYRPHLKLHSKERFLPLNVETFVGKIKPQLCQPRHFADDKCETVELASLLYGAKGYLRLGGERRAGEDLPADSPDVNQIIYYNITRKPGSVSIEYWWFFRFNASPVWDGAMCLAGLSVLEKSCFDHQGDWEGVTVTLLEEEGAEPRPGFVSFYGHNWPGYRYRWETLKGWGSIQGTNPVVYAAKGSHASYPRPCLANCTQQDFRFKVLGIDVPLPDGEHDGFKDAPPLNCICLIPLPVDFDGRPAGWNAFRGKWGAPLCTFVLKSCTRSYGPPSPAFQRHYSKPHRSEWASVEGPTLKGSEPLPSETSP